MKIFIKGDELFYIGGVVKYNYLTYGKSYLVDGIINNGSKLVKLRIINDQGYYLWYDDDHFVKIEEFRNKQIDIII